MENYEFRKMLKSLNPGEHLTFWGTEWIALDKVRVGKRDGVFSMTAKIYAELPFDTDHRNNWAGSSLRCTLNANFLDEAGRNILLACETDLTADNGDKTYGKTSDYVTVLSADQYRKYRDIVPLFDEWMWLCTPRYCIAPKDDNASHLRVVNSMGILSDKFSHISLGAAPVCIFRIGYL